MRNNNSKEVIYELIVDDIQTVAQEVIDRDLSEEEIAKIKALIGEKINWFDVVEDIINEIIDINN